MSRIQQPSNVIKLTNVSFVRLKKGKKRFELACYKNKVMEFREGIETNPDEVLQIPRVFLNVSKGQAAPKEDLDKAFGKGKSEQDIIMEILKKGEVQISKKERDDKLSRIHSEVIDIVASKLIDPRTKRPHTTGIIEKALDMLSTQAHGGGAQSGTATPQVTEDNEAKPDDENAEDNPATNPRLPIWTGVVTTKNAKSQALEAMKALIAHQPIPVTRARMRLRITCSTSVLKQTIKVAAATQESTDDGDDGQQKVSRTIKDRILSYVEQVETQDVIGSEWEVTGFVEPGNFKLLSEFIGNETKGQGNVEVLDMAVTHED